jgi:hypothetical protein
MTQIWFDARPLLRSRRHFSARPRHARDTDRCPAPASEAIGATLLGWVAARLLVVDVTCNGCERCGRLHTTRLFAEQGADMPVG